MARELSKGMIISFIGIEPSKAGEYWTTNRHDCLVQPQIKTTINKDGSFETLCPGCGANPTVIYEMGKFCFFRNIIG
jgi:hypothetical protein